MFLYKHWAFNFSKMTPSVILSGNPPLFEIITAHPLLLASKLDLPNGSSQVEQATAIDVFSNFFNTS